ncbi:MAG: hypothetical protein ABIG42_01695 [bacterium]
MRYLPVIITSVLVSILGIWIYERFDRKRQIKTPDWRHFTHRIRN